MNMMRKTLFIIHFSLFMSTMLTSCGVVEFDVDTEAQPALSMTLDHDTVYVMAGDRFALTPVFTPDTISNKAVFFLSDNDGVGMVDEDSIVAVSPGWARISAVSVSGRFMATCDVCVFPRWQLTAYDYPNDMLVFASVSIDGQEPDADTMVAALYGDEPRGIGQWQTFGNYRCMVFRIWDDGEMEEPRQIRFFYYDRKAFRLGMFPQWIAFDGETHGTPAKPVELKK